VSTKLTLQASLPLLLLENVLPTRIAFYGQVRSGSLEEAAHCLGDSDIAELQAGLIDRQIDHPTKRLRVRQLDWSRDTIFPDLFPKVLLSILVPSLYHSSDMASTSSLNQSLTAAWAIPAVPAVRKKSKKTIPLNQPASPEAELATDDKPVRRKRPRNDAGTLSAKYAPPDLKLSLLGGLEIQITQLLEIVVLPLLHPEIYQYTGVPRPRGVLLHGVPGGGKTQLVKCLAGVGYVWIV
jgi:hypothetical protein